MSKNPLRFTDVLYNIIRACIAVGIVAAVAGYYIDVSQRDTIVIQGIPERPSETEATEQLVSLPEDISSLPEQTMQQEDIQTEIPVQQEDVRPAAQDEYSVEGSSVPSMTTSPVTSTAVSTNEPVEINIAELQEVLTQPQDESYSPSESGGLININIASASKLTELDGIGEVKARAIVEYREEHGGFQTVDDLVKVSGIGEKTLEKNRDRITV